MAASSDSKRLQALSRNGLIVVAIALVLTLLGGWIATMQSVSTIDSRKLDNYRSSLQSYVNESLLMAYQYKHGRALASYTAVSIEKLHQAVSDLNDQLQTETPNDSIKKQVAQTADQANDLADTLAAFSKTAQDGAPGDYTQPLTHLQQELEKS